MLQSESRQISTEVCLIFTDYFWKLIYAKTIKKNLQLVLNLCGLPMPKSQCVYRHKKFAVIPKNVVWDRIQQGEEGVQQSNLKTNYSKRCPDMHTREDKNLKSQDHWRYGVFQCMGTTYYGSAPLLTLLHLLSMSLLYVFTFLPEHRRTSPRVLNFCILTQMKNA